MIPTLSAALAAAAKAKDARELAETLRNLAATAERLADALEARQKCCYGRGRDDRNQDLPDVRGRGKGGCSRLSLLRSSFDAAPEQIASTVLDQSAQPDAGTKLLLPGEEAFVWARCRWVMLLGTLVVTSDRLILLADLGASDSHEFRTAQKRQVEVYEHGVQIVFGL